MSKGRNRSRHCEQCHSHTRSVTGLCIQCRPVDAIPLVHRDGAVVSVAGLNLTEAQAIKLADALIDSIERKFLQ